MHKPALRMMLPAKIVTGLFVLVTVSLPVSAQNAVQQTSEESGAQEAESPKVAITRTQPTAPVPSNAPRFVSSGLEIKIASFGVSKKERNGAVGVTTSLIIVNNNDFDVALLNVESFNVIDNAGNSWRGAYTDQRESNVNGVMACFRDITKYCMNKKDSYFVPPENYTVVSAQTAITLTYYVRGGIEDDVGELFTFSTKMMMYKVGSDNEIAKTTKVEKPRLITIGIPNILRTKS